MTDTGAAIFLGAAVLAGSDLHYRSTLIRGQGGGGGAAAALKFRATVAPVVPSQAGEAVVSHYECNHLSESAPGAETFPSPLLSRAWPRNLNFVGLHDEVLESQLLGSASGAAAEAGGSARGEVRAFVRAGPVERLYWDPKACRAAVVTCGGLCPGLNTVVREIVMCCYYVYGTQEVYGVPNGYGGFYSGAPWRRLTPEGVSQIHTLGGTVLGSSRGGFDLEKILGALVERGINLLFVVGGDGTHRGILALIKGASARGLRISIVGVPKTIDNDIALCVLRRARARARAHVPPCPASPCALTPESLPSPAAQHRQVLWL